MNPDAYEQMARQEDWHWWFAARRRIIASVLSTLHLPNEAKILEIGSGTGGNLKMLAQYGAVTAVEKHHEAVLFSKQRNLNNVEILQEDFQDLTLSSKRFDLICALDVLEHLSDDVLALKKMRELLSENGTILLTVPAYQWLWSTHDDNLHHFRRYNRKDVLDKLQQAGFGKVHISYFNCLLFPAALISRIVNNMLRRNIIDDSSNLNSIMNEILLRIFAAERFILRHFNMPFGLSLLAVARLPQKHSA